MTLVFDLRISSRDGSSSSGCAHVCRDGGCVPACLVEACGKEVQRCEDAAIGSQGILLHYVFVIHLHHAYTLLA